MGRTWRRDDGREGEREVELERRHMVGGHAVRCRIRMLRRGEIGGIKGEVVG